MQALSCQSTLELILPGMVKRFLQRGMKVLQPRFRSRAGVTLSSASGRLCLSYHLQVLREEAGYPKVSLHDSLI